VVRHEWEDEYGRFCLFENVFPDPSLSTEAQFNDTFAKLSTLLERAQYSFTDVLRTWFFLDDIFANYPLFNRIRNQVFQRMNLLGKAPASTAVGAPNRRGSALEGHLLALRPNPLCHAIVQGASPAQGAALDYGSAFSRSCHIRCAPHQRLYVSGTASIDRAGSTVHPASPTDQIRETFRVVEALLEHQGFRFEHVVQATAYLPATQDPTLAHDLWSQHLQQPFSFVTADICRPDLTFEIELVAENLS
jgi:enamine deaminase RidA (YjgF/YER057c/UK114 family)